MKGVSWKMSATLLALFILFSATIREPAGRLYEAFVPIYFQTTDRQPNWQHSDANEATRKALTKEIPDSLYRRLMPCLVPKSKPQAWVYFHFPDLNGDGRPDMVFTGAICGRGSTMHIFMGSRNGYREVARGSTLTALVDTDDDDFYWRAEILDTLADNKLRLQYLEAFTRDSLIRRVYIIPADLNVEGKVLNRMARIRTDSQWLRKSPQEIPYQFKSGPGLGLPANLYKRITGRPRVQVLMEWKSKSTQTNARTWWLVAAAMPGSTDLYTGWIQRDSAEPLSAAE